ncbi:hypothetical protein HZH66_010099 [Vespula vulgaris]|uniref:Uncharacterized protein n=1 Tax=Vespula vulgaris TaxID=7454 RepID=A0A834JKT9_VESVU|nr:hypothetical protein HZH66_010099 [Vespula vulgaris]
MGWLRRGGTGPQDQRVLWNLPPPLPPPVSFGSPRLTRRQGCGWSATTDGGGSTSTPPCLQADSSKLVLHESLACKINSWESLPVSNPIPKIKVNRYKYITPTTILTLFRVSEQERNGCRNISFSPGYRDCSSNGIGFIGNAEEGSLPLNHTIVQHTILMVLLRYRRYVRENVTSCFLMKKLGPFTDE